MDHEDVTHRSKECKVLTTICFTVKVGLRKYCEDIYSTNGVNQMWIFINS